MDNVLLLDYQKNVVFFFKKKYFETDNGQNLDIFSCLKIKWNQ